MDLRQLEIFAKVAEFKSFSKAAQALRLTQPTISEHIRTLEQELGVRLLDRLGRGAEVTRAGQLLLSHALRMLQLQREALQAMDSFQGRLAGDLHVAASTIPGEYILPALIGRFKEKFPDIAITLLVGDSRGVVDWVVDGRAEVAVVGARLPHRGVECRGDVVWCLKLRALKITRVFHIAIHRDRSRSPLAEAFRSCLEAEST